MKFFWTLAFLSSLCTQSFAVVYDHPRSVVFRTYNYQEQPKMQMIPGMRQKLVGISLTSAGLGFTAVGAILMATSNWRKVQTSYGTTYGTNDMKAAIGSLFCTAGIGLTVPGGIIWGVGERKIKRFRKNALQNTEPPKPVKKPLDSESIPVQERF